MEKQKKRSVTVILFALVLIVAVAGAVAFALRSKPAEAPAEDGNKLQFASEGVTALDEENLQSAVDELAKMKNPIAVYYSPGAYSEDGTNFICNIGNSPANKTPAYFALYTDAECTDQICLTGALRPNESFKTLTLDRALEKGTHTVYVAETLVDEDLTTALNQIVFTIDFTVT